MALQALLLLTMAGPSKLAASKVAPSENSCSEPVVKIDGVRQSGIPVSETVTLSDGRKLEMRSRHEELQLTYVHALLDGSHEIA